MDCIASLSINGAVLVPSHLRGILNPRIKNANGFIGDKAEFEKMTGRTINDFVRSFTGGLTEGYEDRATINTGLYIMV
ncbi:MAG: hypothetical protein LBF95_03835 [Treponema sp.]|nr:hypothetical protein [Treponema sp.]